VSDDVNFVLRARREKLSALEASGVQAFAYGFSRTHEAADAVAALGGEAEGPVVRVAGRGKRSSRTSPT